MKRIAPIQKPSRANPLDWVVWFSVILIPACYGLGFHLDWTQESPEAGDHYTATAETHAAPPMETATPLPTVAGSPEAAASADLPADATAAAGNNPEEERWAALARRLQVEAISYPGRVAIFLKDLKHDKIWAYQADDLFPSASLIKVPIMISVFDKIHRGELTLQTKMTLRRRHHTGGSGSLKWYRDGAQFTVRQLLEKMIDESDNTATRMMIESVGLGYLQQQFPKLGLLYTEIYPEGLSLQSSRVTYENYTTAREMASMLEKIYRGDMVDRYSSEIMLNIMKHQKTKARLAKGLPVGWEIAHKTGLLRGACHDTAIIFTPDGDYVLTVLTGQNKNYGRAKDFIARLGRITYQYYKGDEALVAKAAPGTRRRQNRRGTGSID